MGKVLDTLHKSGRKGETLERVLEDALKDAGFFNVRRQFSGSQYGFDVTAQRISPLDGRQEVWVFECKNLSRPINVDDIAPKLVWNYGKAVIDRFVIVGTSAISNDLDQMLKQHQFSMQVGVWTDDNLEELIENSPQAMQRLGLSYNQNSGKPKLDIDKLPYYPQNSVTFDVTHQLNPPFAFDYVAINSSIVKAFNSFELRLLATIANPVRTPLEGHSLSVTTLNYQKVDGRVVRLMKMKGIFKPIESTFTPSRNIGGSKDLLNGNVWRVEGGATESIALILDRGTPSGLYQVMFTINGKLEGRQITRHSPSFAIHVPDDNTDLVRLYVVDRHYDSPTIQILNLDAATWGKLKQEVRDPYKMVFLGPSMREIMINHVDTTWVIRACKVIPDKDGSATINPANPTTVIHDLQTPIDEEVISLDKFMTQLTGTDKWYEFVIKTLEQAKGGDDS
ncbi:MAG TPA: hypothetical protein VF528_20930 [Pyrinomonadaceae bacterium]|jgi:hypothetical protein